MNEYEGKYFLEKNVRLKNGEVSCIKQDYATADEAEIAYHNEVAYGLANQDIILAHYDVVNEYGVKYEHLEKLIDRVPAPEPEEEQPEQGTEPAGE